MRKNEQFSGKVSAMPVIMKLGDGVNSFPAKSAYLRATRAVNDSLDGTTSDRPFMESPNESVQSFPASRVT